MFNTLQLQADGKVPFLMVPVTSVHIMGNPTSELEGSQIMNPCNSF